MSRDARKPDDLVASVQAFLRAWHKTDPAPMAALASLLVVRAMSADAPDPSARHAAIQQVLSNCLAQLAASDHRAADLLRARYLSGDKMAVVARRLHLGVDAANRAQRSALRRLAAILREREAAARAARARASEAELPPATYAALFGVEGPLARLERQLTLRAAPWVLSISGLGGLGKTALADAVARRLIQPLAFERILWLRAGANRLTGATLSGDDLWSSLLLDLAERLWPNQPPVPNPVELRLAIRRALKAHPHLVVLDNLETEADLSGFLVQVQDLAEPSKFLLTSRARPPGESGIRNLNLDELPLAAASQVVQAHAAAIGFEPLARASRADLRAIYQVVGGNPLALKLVASLAVVLPLRQVLAELAAGRPGPAEILYRNIYLRVWRVLSVEAQTLLQAMPLVAGAGALPQQLLAISGLDEPALGRALQELAERSLLEIRGTLHQRRYGLHRLTESFLRTEIVRWPSQVA